MKLPRYCKAYRLGDLRNFPSWSEHRKSWSTKKYWSDHMQAAFEKSFEDSDVVFVHHDLRVTKSTWHDEHIIFDNPTPAWARFCRDQLAFAIPEDLLGQHKAE